MSNSDKKATVGNIAAFFLELKNQFMGKESYQSLRKNMGLGDTLGALPVENGGTGGTTLAELREDMLVERLDKMMIPTAAASWINNSWSKEFLTGTIPSGFYVYYLAVHNPQSSSRSAYYKLSMLGLATGSGGSNDGNQATNIAAGQTLVIGSGLVALENDVTLNSEETSPYFRFGTYDSEKNQVLEELEYIFRLIKLSDY